MFFALMAIDGEKSHSKSIVYRSSYYIRSGIFKNNQAQIDEYMRQLNPLLRRTTEGNLFLGSANDESY